jgi:hypothetical protein
VYSSFAVCETGRPRICQFPLLGDEYNGTHEALLGKRVIDGRIDS